MHKVTQVRDLTSCLECIGYGAILRQYVSIAVEPKTGDQLRELTAMLVGTVEQWHDHAREGDHAAQ